MFSWALQADRYTHASSAAPLYMCAHVSLCVCVCVSSLYTQVKKVKDYIKEGGSAFTYEGLKSISIAGAGLLKWVLAMVNYNNVAKTVEPKRKKVADSEKNLRIAQVRTIWHFFSCVHEFPHAQAPDYLCCMLRSAH